MPHTFFITGVSSGFGHALAARALEQGHTVAGTVRKPADAMAFEALGGIAKLADVTDDAAITAAVDEVERDTGPIDVLVANAGYGHEGTVEESTMDDLRRQFDGSDALRLVAAGRAAVEADIERWDDLSRSTDFATGAQIA